MDKGQLRSEGSSAPLKGKPDL